MMKRIYKLCMLVVVIIGTWFVAQSEQKPMVLIVPSYNNARWYKANLDSIFMQEYDNYRVIYIDDCSPDGTGRLVRAYLDEHNLWDRVTLICNEQRCGAMENIYHAIHSCNDLEIMVNLDGDDFLAHDHVLQKLNEIYTQEHVWLTYGQFVEYPAGKVGFCEGFPSEVVQNNSFRKHGCPVSHIRTFYAWLFKKIKQEDLLYEGRFYPMTWDKAMMLPMLEMSAGRFKFIPDILYIYNFSNPINDCRVNGELQAHLARVILGQAPYEALKENEIPATMR